MLLSQTFLATIGLLAPYTAAAGYSTDARPVPDAHDGPNVASIWIQFSVKGAKSRSAWYNINSCYDLNGKPNIQAYEIRASSPVKVTLQSEYGEGGVRLHPHWSGPTDGQQNWGPHRVGSFCVANA